MFTFFFFFFFLFFKGSDVVGVEKAGFVCGVSACVLQTVSCARQRVAKARVRDEIPVFCVFCFLILGLHQLSAHCSRH
jgi:hypothetical protein